MNRKIAIPAAVAAVLLLIFAGGYLRPIPRQPVASTASAQAILAVSGMTCTGCEYSVEAACRLLEGVHTATADFREESVVIAYDPALVKAEELAKAVTIAGYPAEARITKSLKEVDNES